MLFGYFIPVVREIGRESMKLLSKLVIEFLENKLPVIGSRDAGIWLDAAVWKILTQ